MAERRFLLMYLTRNSGHHRASRAIAQSIRALDPLAQIVSVDAFRFSSPFVRWAISRSYLSLIRHQPDIWEYLYDNPAVHRQVKHLQALLHRYQASKVASLLDTVKPDAIACTQAYPCGVLADFKKHHALDLPLVGVLTDYAPHLYWFHDKVDAYIVPSEQVKHRFLTQRVESERVKVLGIPIDPTFHEPTDREATARRFGLDLAKPILLIMGGGSGFGQLRDILQHLDILPYPCQLLVMAGTNRSLLTWIATHRFRHLVRAIGYTTDVPQLMDVATLLVSKPGGLTTSEALAKRLPLVIVNPIPGQEAYNARFLLSEGAAVSASLDTVRQTVRDLLDNPDRLDAIRTRQAELAHPQGSLKTAQLLLELADRYRSSDGGAANGAVPVRPYSLLKP